MLSEGGGGGDGGGGGLNLMGYEPKWTINALCMDNVRAYLEAFARENNCGRRAGHPRP